MEVLCLSSTNVFKKYTSHVHTLSYFFGGAVIIFSLYLVSVYSYLLFHSLAELFSVVVAAGIFIVALNSRKFVDNNYLLLLGISSVFIAGFDLLHTLSYKGMGIFPGYDTNLPTQFWLAARYLQSASFLAAALFLRKKININNVIIVYSLVFVFLLTSIFYGFFPVAYIEGTGLTLFKVVSEYLISLALFTSFVILIIKRKEFDSYIFRLLTVAIVLTIASELSFTLYTDPYGYFNLLGHFLKVGAFYLIYKALIETCFKEPHSILYRNLKLSEDRLKESEQRFRTVAETAADAIVLADSFGKIIFWNRAARHIFGYKSREALGKPLTLIMPRRFQGAHTESFGRAVAAGKLNKDGGTRKLTGVKKDGTEFPLELSLAKIETDKGLIFTAMIRDTTESDTARDALQKSEQKYREIVETSQEGIWIINKSREIIYANRRMAEMLGLDSPKKLVGRPLFDFLDAEERRHIELNAERRIKGIREKCLRKADGRLLWTLESISSLVDSSGKYVGILEMMTDITSKKATEEERERMLAQIESDRRRQEKLVEILRQENAEDEALLESIGDGIVAVDHIGRILYTNKSFRELIGIDEKTVRHEDLHKCIPLYDKNGNNIPTSDRPVVIALSGQKFISGIIGDHSFWFRRGNGSLVPLAITATPIILDGKISGAIAVYRDVTRETEIDRAKTEFVSLASHQLRTPLATISLASELIFSNNDFLNQEQKRYAKDISDSIKEMTSLIEALLNVSRIEMGTLIVNPERTNIVALSDDAVKKFRHQIDKKHIFLKKDYQKNLPNFLIDKKLFCLILENLISNALKYSWEKGRVELAIKTQKDNLLIKVADAGCGIPKYQQDKIFGKLFRSDNALKSKTQGTGLGLYIVRAAVNQYGGKVWFDSEENKGSVFYVKIPIDKIKIKNKNEVPVLTNKNK